MKIKKLFLLLMTIAVLVSVAACDADDGRVTDDEEIKAQLPGKDGKVTVLLDAGHGFGDVGCTSEYLNGLYEKDITVSYVDRLREKLEERGIEVLLTHDGATYMHETELVSKADEYGVEYNEDNIKDNGVFDAYERAIYVNVLLQEREVDYFISLHVNANADSDECEGFEIDYCKDNGYSKSSRYVFRSICNSIEEAFPDTPRKEFEDSWEDAFIVTKYTSLPSALFEIGFATTPSDAEKILDLEWQSKLTDALAEGIAVSFGK